MALPTFTWKPTFSLNMTVDPRVTHQPLGDGYAEHTPVGFRPGVRTWSLQFEALRLDKVKPIRDFLKGRGGYKMFQWTPPEPDTTPGIWIARRWEINRPNGVIYNLRTVFEEQ